MKLIHEGLGCICVAAAATTAQASFENKVKSKKKNSTGTSMVRVLNSGTCNIGPTMRGKGEYCV